MTEIVRQESGVPDRIGQATQIEQARAVAEVQGAIVVAQQVPRSMPVALAQLRESCAQRALAERAFFRYSRGQGQITGPSIHLAREVARCFGNIQYGLTELSRNDSLGESQMQAWAWDVQTNTRASTTFIVKHVRDTKQGAKALTDVRDIYENNANMGARRLREQIFAVVPAWFTEEAKSVASKTLESDSSGKTVAQRSADIVDWFSGKFGVVADQLETKLGRPVSQWTVQDLAVLQVVGTSLGRGEVTVDEEFPTLRVTADEIRGQRAPSPEAETIAQVRQPEDVEPDWAAIEAQQATERVEVTSVTDPEPVYTDVPTVPGPEPMSRPQMQAIQARLTELGARSSDKKHGVVTVILGRPITTMNAVSKDEATRLIDVLNPMTAEVFRSSFEAVLV